MIIKKYIYVCMVIASLSLFCTSCRKDVDMIEKENIVYNDARLYQRLDSLSEVYSSPPNSPSSVVRKKQTADTEFTKEQQNRISQADMAGYAIGYGMGVGTGCLIATVSPPAGVAIGLTSAFALAEIFAVKWSSVEADKIREETKTKIVIEDLYKLDPYHPINDFSSITPWFDSTIPGASAGFLHNYFISVLYNEHPEDFFELSADQLTDGVVDLLLQGSYDDYKIEEVRAFAYNYLEQYLANWSSESSIVASDEVILHYFQLLKDIPEENNIAFTGEYMRIVSQEISNEDRVTLINGCLSTYVYSLHLWNLNVPYLYQTDYLCQKKRNGEFITMACTDPYETVPLWLAANDFSMILTPVIREERIVALFVFDKWNPYFADSIINNRYVQMDGNIAYLNAIDNPAIIFEKEGNRYVCPEGLYEFQEFEEGYVVLF